MKLQKAKHCSVCPTTHQCLWFGNWGRGGGGNWKIARSSSNDKERAAQPRSDVCIIVVVTKCSWLIIPPSFANRAAANLHINGASEGYDVKECGLSVWLSLGSRGHQPYNKQDSPHPRVLYHLPSLQNPQHKHHTPCCVSLINRRNRMEDRLLFGRGGVGWGGTDWHSEELSAKSAGCPWISSVVTQPHAPWRSFRQLSRTRPAAVLNSSLQRPTPDEQLQHTGQFPYKPPLPSPLSFTHSSSTYASRHFDCANEHNTPLPTPNTHS